MKIWKRINNSDRKKIKAGKKVVKTSNLFKFVIFEGVQSKRILRKRKIMTVV